MPKRNGWRLAAALGLLIVLVGAALAAYDAIWPRQSGTLPDIDGCYESKMGICQDLAAMAACMLRVQGIPTRLMIGYAGKMYHAWNTVIINGEEVLYDPTLELSAIDSGLTYTVERYY